MIHFSHDMKFDFASQVLRRGHAKCQANHLLGHPQELGPSMLLSHLYYCFVPSNSIKIARSTMCCLLEFPETSMISLRSSKQKKKTYSPHKYLKFSISTCSLQFAKRVYSSFLRFASIFRTYYTKLRFIIASGVAHFTTTTLNSSPGEFSLPAF